MTIKDLFKTIQETSKTNAKKSIVKENMSDTLKLIFEDTYGDQKYYIKKFEPTGDCGDWTIDYNYEAFHLALTKLANREYTGNAAHEYLQKVVSQYNAEDQDILYKIIDRNLKIGISLDNFLDCIGEKELKYEVAKAENLSKVKGVDPTNGTYFISRKLDGVRCVCFIEKTDNMVQVSFRSRQNKIIYTLDNLVDYVVKFVSDLNNGSWVLDGMEKFA